MSHPETKHRILDAAEGLFAEQGYAATSLRAITVAADVNVAAIHYHFGNKQSLLEALFDRRVRDVNDERLRGLDALEQQPEPPSLEALLRVFLEPAIRRLGSGDAGWMRFTRVMGRMLGESGEHVRAIHQVFLQIRMRFLPAFRRALPHLSEEDLAWRMHLMIGSLCFVLADPSRLALMTQGRCDATDAETTLDQFVAFARGGFESPTRSASRAGGTA